MFLKKRRFVLIATFFCFSFLECCSGGGDHAVTSLPTEPSPPSACSGSSPTWTCTADYASVNSCVSQSSAGDTINISAGTATWTKYITINKGITIKGAGIGHTIITDNGTGTYGLFNVTVPDNQRFILSDIEIQGGTSQSHSQGVIYLNGNAQDYMKFRITNCKFISHRAFILKIQSIYGLIDSNQFLNMIVKGYHYVWVIGDGDTAFSRSVSFGSANAVFVEHNLISNAVARSAWLEQWNGSRMVVRYNTIKNAWISSHGYQDVTANARGSLLLEYYNNEADCDDNTGPDYCYGAIDFRSGTGVITNNIWTETGGATWSDALTGGVGMNYYGLVNAANNACGSTSQDWRNRCLAYPCPDQPGYTGTASNPVYIWSNTVPYANFIHVNYGYDPHDGYNCDTSPMVYNASDRCNAGSAVLSCFIKQNREYFFAVKPGYLIYSCPHPLVGSGSCSNVPGRAGYTLQ